MSKTKSTLRSLMEKKTNGVSARRMQLTTQYSKLPQNISDDDEEMNIEGHVSENHQNQNNHKQEIVELEKLYPSDKEEILIQGQRLSRARTVCFVMSLFFCVAFTLAFIFVAPCQQLPCGSKYQNKSIDWEKTFSEYAISTHLVLVDSDHKHQNILLGLIPFKDNNSIIADECKIVGGSFCTVFLLLHGITAKEIWRFPFKSIINFIICQADINSDGRKDCIMSGTGSFIMALDPQKGIILWKSESPLLKDYWNAFTPQVLQDFDGDGIPEFALWLSCDNKVFPKTSEHDRLIMISGKTGNVMPYYLEIPGSKQSSIPPIVYRKSDGSSYILLSSVEESENTAALWMISFPDFYRLVENFPSNYVISKIEGAYKFWPGFHPNTLGVFKIYSSQAKGFPITPVLVDVTQDGNDDIIVGQYGSRLVILSGATWDIVWQRQFEGWESFSLLSPGYFNNDSVLDLMVRLNFGNWPDFNESMVCILDGLTGETLWSISSGLADFSSPLSLHTSVPQRDVFIFATSGRAIPSGSTTRVYLPNYFLHMNKRNVLEPIENLPEIEPYFSQGITPKIPHIHEELQIPQDLIPRISSHEHYESQSEETSRLNLSHATGNQMNGYAITDFQLCNKTTTLQTTEVFLLDRSLQNKAVLLTTFDFGHHHYNFCETVQKERNICQSKKELCALFETTGVLTGVVGDVDADGCLDILLLSEATATLIKEQVHYEVKLKKINIDSKISHLNYVDIKPYMKNWSSLDVSLSTIRFLNLQNQPWNQFLGAHSNGKYMVNDLK